MAPGPLCFPEWNVQSSVKGRNMEEIIVFQSKGLELEGLVGKKISDKGVVITHPHPLYGGDMYNHVVEQITRVYQSRGYITLRFNFRGVGGSSGNYDNGMGEQEDVLSAISCLKDMGAKTVDLAGYSFGSWVNACVVSRDAFVNRLVMVSPPVGFVSFDSIGMLTPLALVVTGSEDDIAPENLIMEKMKVWNPGARFEAIEGADHFYSGHGNELEQILSEVI